MGYILAPNGRWTARDLVGDAAIGAFVYTYANQTTDLKATYQDPAGVTANSNPIILDSSGSANIYWNDDDYYTIIIYSANPLNPEVPDQLIYSQDNYPVVSVSEGGGDITINQASPNLVRNPQFTRWGNNNYMNTNSTQDTLSSLGSGLGALSAINVVCDDWQLSRTNTNATIVMSRQWFPLGQIDVPYNPVSYLNYTCSGIGGGGELFKALLQDYIGVQTLSNREVSFGFWARSSSSSNVSVNLIQYMGSGGGSTAGSTTEVLDVALTVDWTFYSGTATLPTLTGQAVGANNDSSLRLAIFLPLNQTADIDMCNVQLHDAPVLPNFPYLTVNEQLKLSDAMSINSIFITGAMAFGIYTTAPFGWVLCNDSTIGNQFSGASRTGNDTLNLFLLLWNNVSNTYAPIYDSAGTVSTRGANAMADYNANKRLQLTSILGRVIGGAGSGSGLTARTLGSTTGAETVALTSDNNGPHTHDIAIGASTGSGQIRAVLTNETTTTPTESSGLGTPHANMQPTSFATAIIKL